MMMKTKTLFPRKKNLLRWSMNLNWQLILQRDHELGIRNHKYFVIIEESEEMMMMMMLFEMLETEVLHCCWSSLLIFDAIILNY